MWCDIIVNNICVVYFPVIFISKVCPFTQPCGSVSNNRFIIRFTEAWLYQCSQFSSQKGQPKFGLMSNSLSSRGALAAPVTGPLYHVKRHHARNRILPPLPQPLLIILLPTPQMCSRIMYLLQHSLFFSFWNTPEQARGKIRYKSLFYCLLTHPNSF